MLDSRRAIRITSRLQNLDIIHTHRGQVRSIQEAEGSEKICVVFSSGVESWKTSQWQGSASREKVCKVKMYVEAAELDPLSRGCREDPGSGRGGMGMLR